MNHSRLTNGYANVFFHSSTILAKLAKTDLDYLSLKAGKENVLVEPMHPTARQFGTDIERVNVKFKDFIKSLRGDEGPYHYLTTQYAEQDPDALTVLPPPADALKSDYPHVPRLMGNLCLQQVNLWIGRSNDGSTSGLVCCFASQHDLARSVCDPAPRLPR